MKPFRTIIRGGIPMVPVLALWLACSPAGEREVARVGDRVITVADVADVMGSGGYEKDAAGAREALDYLVDFELILLEADREGLAGTEEYDRRVEEARDHLLIRRLLEAEVYDKAVVSEEELRDAYLQRGGDREEIRVRHILIALPEGAPEEKEAEKRAEAEALLERIRSGEDFAELARENSEGPSAHRGGDLGFFPRGGVDPDFEKAAFSLEPGEVSDIVRSRFGFHIIKMEERRTRTLDDVRDRLKETMEEARRSTRQREFMAEVEERANVQYMDEGIERLVTLLGEDPSGATLEEENPVLAVYEGGEWTGRDYLAFYNSLPDTLRVPPKNAREVRDIMAGRVRDAVLVVEALRAGVDRLPGFEEEMDQLREDVLVQLYITRQLFEGVPDEERLRALYDENRDSFPGEFDEEREAVVRMYRDRMEEGGLENLTAPLREKFPVVLTEENISLVPRVLEG
jgi:parvulin-like peptidyl-prolyl isomerase